jgi:hypothetical protein
MDEPTHAPKTKLCSCGRSATGFCVGLHRMSDAEWNAYTFDEQFNAASQTINSTTITTDSTKNDY